MLLFDAGPRSDDQPRRHSEGAFAFLNRVRGPVWEQCRDLLEAWHGAFPQAEQWRIARRLQSGDDRQFSSAFWELYIHEMFRRAGWEATIEPKVPHSKNRPDFVFTNGRDALYVEARCVYDESDAGAAARLHAVYDRVQNIDTGAFWLAVRPNAVGSQSPPTGALRRDLASWLSRLDPDYIEADFTSNDRERFLWIHDDWSIEFHPLARPASTRDDPPDRAIAAYLPSSAQWVDDIGALRAALEDKGTKYGALDHPFVIALNVIRGFHDHRDTAEALFGRIGFSVNFDDPSAPVAPVLSDVGYFGTPEAPRHTQVAGILLGHSIDSPAVARAQPLYYPHPWGTASVATLDLWATVDWAEATFESAEAAPPQCPPHEHFGLPSNWPTGDRFPGTRRGHGH